MSVNNNVNSKANKINPDAALFSKDQVDNILKELGVAGKNIKSKKEPAPAKDPASVNPPPLAKKEESLSEDASIGDILQANFIEDDKEV